MPEISLDVSDSLIIGETKTLSAHTIPEETNMVWESNNSDNSKDYSADCIITVKAQPNQHDGGTISSEIASESDSQEPEANSVSINDVAWLDDIKIYEDDYATTMRGEQWSDCIRFGSSNIISDGNAGLRAVCDKKYSKFTAEIAPQEGF